jgi:CheY-like chemotaxis protein
MVKTWMDVAKPLVLLVEDSDDDAFFFKRTFKRIGTNCLLHHVADGAAAIEVIKQAAIADQLRLPALIFLDLKMPVMNGFEVLTWLREQTFPAVIKVVVLSGSEQAEDKERAARLGASEYLVKPATEEALHRLLGEICPQPAEAGAGA